LWTQILIPILLTAIVLLVVPIVLWMAAFDGAGDVSRWAAISTMWLLIPVMLASVILLVVLVGLIYAAARITGGIPQYSQQAQHVTWRIAGASRRFGEFVRKPMLAVRELGSLAKSRFRRLRERK
jgi:cytochrome b subunit of formate dehydrogenase